MATVCVYCGSSFGNDEAFAVAAEAVGRLIGEGGHRLVYGGGNVGLMGVVADATLAAGGEVIGVIPASLVALEVAHKGLTEQIVVESMHDRKAAMAARADGFIALPGGFGTLDETFEILTWSQLGFVAKPTVFLDVNGYWEHLFAQIDHMIGTALVRPEHRSLAQRALTPAEAIALATGPYAGPPPKWADRVRTDRT